MDEHPFSIFWHWFKKLLNEKTSQNDYTHVFHGRIFAMWFCSKIFFSRLPELLLIDSKPKSTLFTSKLKFANCKFVPKSFSTLLKNICSDLVKAVLFGLMLPKSLLRGNSFSIEDFLWCSFKSPLCSPPPSIVAFGL